LLAIPPFSGIEKKTVEVPAQNKQAMLLEALGEIGQHKI
jgi:hypothetical protein